MLKSHEVSYIRKRKKFQVYMEESYNVVVRDQRVEVERLKSFGPDPAMIEYMEDPEEIDTESNTKWRIVWKP